MGQIDIVARLQLKAEQFSSENGKQFAELKSRAASTAAEVRQSFSSSFAEIQKIAKQSLELPRTAGGSLDLSGEIASLNASASAAENRADAFREMQQAALRAAHAEGGHTEALRRDADAAMVAVRAEEAAAAADRQRIVQLEALQTELDRTASVTHRLGDAQEHSAKKSAAMRQAMQGASYQAQDLFTQISMGTNPLQAFVVQGGQLAGQFSQVEGRAGQLASFFMGPWGLALTAGALVVAKLTEGIFDEDKAHKAAREAAEKHKAAIVDLANAQEKAIQTAERKQALDLAEIKNQLDAAMATRQKTQALLDAALAQERIDRTRANAPGQRGDLAALAAVESTNRAAGLEALLRKNTEATAELQKGLDIGVARLIGMKVDQRSTPEGRIRADYERQRSAAMQDTANLGTANADKLAAKLRELNDQRDRELKALERRTAAGKRDADEASPASIAKLLRDALPGVTITSMTGGRHTKGSDHYRSAAIDFVPKGGMGSMSKADVRALFERAGVPIRRNAAGVEQLFGPGDKGHADHFHVAWEKGKIGLDNYRAAMRDVAEAQRDQKKAAAEAAAEQKRLDAELDQVLKALDPAAAALGRYNDRLADLARLEGAGKISLDRRMDLTREARAELSEAQSKAANDNFRQVFGPERVDAVLADWDRVVKTSTDEFGQGVRAAGVFFGDQVRFGVDGMLDLLQVKLPGSIQRLLQPGGIEGQARGASEALVKGLRSAGIKLDDASAERLAQKLGTVFSNASYGQVGGSVFASITGGRENKAASAVGGVIGGELGKIAGPAIAKTIGGTLGKTLGTAAGPLGAIAGGILCNVIGGLLTKTKKGSSTLMFGDGGLYAGGATGNSGSAKAAAAASANSVVGAINRVAEALGGEILGAGSVSIGKRKDQFVVDTSGRGRTKGAGTLSFGSEEEAIRAAIADVLRDGVVGGISDASKRILAAGGDLEKAVTKASLIEAVPRDLKAMLDPVGFALDELNRKFRKTVDALKEGGASAEQMAQAQRLYDLQLEQVKASTASAAQGLKDFLLELKIGGSSPLSLRDQEAAALAQLQPFLNQIDAGQSIDQAKYQSAAKAYLDVEKQLYGSTEQFFAAFERVQASTTRAIAAAENVQPIAPAVESPFAKATADGVQAGNEIGAQHTELLARIAIAIESWDGGGGGSGFIGAGRGFVVAN